MPAKRSPLRVVAVVLVLAAVAAAVAWFTLGKRSEEGPKYRVETVDRGTVAETVTATGSISAVTTVRVGSQVSGIIARLHADFNSPVRQGQLLAELDPTPFEAQVAQRRADLVQAEVQMRRAKIDFDRQSRLLADQLAAEADYDTAKANFDAAEAQVEQARAALSQSETNLRYTRILSPIDGVVVDRQYDVGQTVAASFQAPTLFTIAQDLTKMQVQADVDQSDIGRIKVGQPARFTVDAYPEVTFEATISQVRLNATVNQNVITYPVILAVPNPEEKLRPNMTANVTIEVARIENALRVPNAALRFRPVETGEPKDDRPKSAGRPGSGVEAAAAAASAVAGGKTKGKRGQTVYLLGEGDALEEVAVRAGITDGRFTAIVDDSLKEGSRIVVGLATLKVEGSGSFPGQSPLTPQRGGPGGGRRGM